MASFKSLDTKNTKQRELDLSKYWQEIDLLDKTFTTREDADEYIIFDGIQNLHSPNRNLSFIRQSVYRLYYQKWLNCPR